jgi:DNA-binding transcriptional MerR regulator
MTTTVQPGRLMISAVARATGYSSDYIRDLCKQGVITPKRNSNGQREFHLGHVDALLTRKRQVSGGR